MEILDQVVDLLWQAIKNLKEASNKAKEVKCMQLAEEIQRIEKDLELLLSHRRDNHASN
jgi:hypothetical protein